MSETNPLTQNLEGGIIPFLSLASLRAAHRELLQRRREEESQEFLEAVHLFIRRGQAAGAYLDDDEDRWAAQNLLDFWENHLYHAGLEPPEAILDEFNPALQPEIPDSLCPYIGLDAFQQADSKVFFGREHLINELTQQVINSRLVAVFGPSGSGKSSTVLAGLLPKLQAGIPQLLSENWRFYPPLVPGSDPLTALARTLQRSEPATAEQLAMTVAHLHQDTAYLTEAVNETGEEPAVFTVDQFEEIFTLCHNEAERHAFIGNLLQLIQSPGPRHTVILTMRTDYESHLATEPLLQSLVEENATRVTSMKAAELREAVEKPAELVGLKFEEGLVDEIIREVLGEPAALPLLQFTLLQLWEARERNRITWEMYRQLGGVFHALGNTADLLYTSQLPEDQVTTKRILLRLVQPSEGLEFTRRRVRCKALFQAGEAEDRVNRVLERLIQAQLIRLQKGNTPDDDQVEIAYEALVRNWPRLVEWLDEERVQLRQRLRLANQAQQWETLGRDPGALLRGTLLEVALGYDNLNDLEVEFVRASQDAVTKAEKEKEEARQRELTQARQLAKEQRQRAEAQAIAARRLRSFNVAIMLIFVVVVLGLALWARNRQLQNDAASAAAELAFRSTSEAFAAQATIQAQALTEATIQAQQTLTAQQVATSNAQVIARATTDSATAAAAVAATATFQVATAQAQAIQSTQAARLTPTVSGSDPTSQATPTLEPQVLTSHFGVDAQLKAIVRAEDNMRMVYVTGHTFMMGADDNDVNASEDEKPVHMVVIDDFYIDQYEASIQQYAAFINRRGGYKQACDGFDCVATGVETQSTYLLNNLGIYESKSGTENFPVNWVSWYGASAYCQSVNARLPTEAEWEYAARGIDGRLYPWGNDLPEPNRARFGYPNTSGGFIDAFRPAGTLSEGVSPFGVFDLAGSVWEWVQDWYDPTYYATDPGAVPNENSASGMRVLRGGAWRSRAESLRTTERFGLRPQLDISRDSHFPGIGFRCARDSVSTP